MLYDLSQYLLSVSADTPWADWVSPLRVFRYITFRSGGAAITALLLSWWLGPRVIAWLKALKFGQHYLDKAEASSQRVTPSLLKQGVPTMGGVLMVMVLDLTALLWARWNAFVLLTLLSVVVLAGLGFYDDFLKITQQDPRGVKGRLKIWVQLALALFIALYLWWLPPTHQLIADVLVPFYKYPVLTQATGAGMLITVLAIVGSSNAVNLTDGMDGLAIGCTLIVSFVFLVLTYVAGNVRFATYLQVPYVPGTGELTVVCAAMIGAGLGFLWYNCYPAEVFMGDTGSLALGGALGIMAVLIHQPLLLIIAGGVFVAEAGSVIVQKAWFKYTRLRWGTGRRVFLMAPIHHHFRELGWPESKIVTRFYILCLLCAVVALSTLKIR